MNKSQLIEKVARKTKLSKTQSEVVLDAFIETITAAVSDGKDVKLVGFGVFDAYERKSRKARNPKTGESVSVPAMTVPRFRPGKEFRESVISSK